MDFSVPMSDNSLLTLTALRVDRMPFITQYHVELAHVFAANYGIAQGYPDNLLIGFMLFGGNRHSGY
jgi:hypothetical protein